MKNAKMVPVIGTCKFCLQEQTVMVPEGKEYTKEEIDQLATDQCDCNAAEDARDQHDAEQMIVDKIKELRIKDEKLSAMLQQQAVRVSRGELQCIAVKDANGYVYQIAGARFNIKMVVKQTKKTRITVDKIEEEILPDWKEDE